MAAKIMRHPAVGDLELTGEALTLPGDHGLTIIAYTVEPERGSEQVLNFLGSWSAQASLRSSAPRGIAGQSRDS